jgi:hypothetical protein
MKGHRNEGSSSSFNKDLRNRRILNSGQNELEPVSFESLPETQQFNMVDLVRKHEKSIYSLRNTNIALTAVNILVFLVVVLIGGGSIVWNGWQESVIQSNSHNLDIVEDEVDALIECTGEFCEDPDIFKNITSVVGTVNELVNCTEFLCDNPDIFEEIADNFTTTTNDINTLETCTTFLCNNPDVFEDISDNFTVITGDINTLETCTQPLCDNPEILNNLTVDLTQINNTLNALVNCTEELCENPNIFTDLNDTIETLVICTEDLCQDPTIIVTLNNSVNTLVNCTEDLCENPNFVNETQASILSLNETVETLVNCTEFLCANPDIFDEISANFTSLNNSIQETSITQGTTTGGPTLEFVDVGDTWTTDPTIDQIVWSRTDSYVSGAFYLSGGEASGDSVTMRIVIPDGTLSSGMGTATLVPTDFGVFIGYFRASGATILNIDGGANGFRNTTSGTVATLGGTYDNMFIRYEYVLN